MQLLKFVEACVLLAFIYYERTSSLSSTEDPTCPGQWKLTWSDEFEGSEIDNRKWTHEIGKFYNNELEFYTATRANSFVQDGLLVIQAINQSGNYTSARLITNGTFGTKYGRIEMRAKLPFGQGMWPAFWMLGDKDWWPKCGEIDIMEFIGRQPKHVYSALHSVRFDTVDNFTDENGFSNDFHVFTAFWNPGRISFAVDGILFAEQSINDAKMQSGDWPFDQEGYNAFIILNLAVGGDWPGNPDSTTQFPQRFLIDYVRVYKCMAQIRAAHWNLHRMRNRFIIANRFCVQRTFHENGRKSAKIFRQSVMENCRFTSPGSLI